MSKAHERVHFTNSIARGDPICEEKGGVRHARAVWKGVTCRNCLAEKPRRAAATQKGEEGA